MDDVVLSPNLVIDGLLVLKNTEFIGYSWEGYHFACWPQEGILSLYVYLPGRKKWEELHCPVIVPHPPRFVSFDDVDVLTDTHVYFVKPNREITVFTLPFDNVIRGELKWVSGGIIILICQENLWARLFIKGPIEGNKIEDRSQWTVGQVEGQLLEIRSCPVMETLVEAFNKEYGFRNFPDCFGQPTQLTLKDDRIHLTTYGGCPPILTTLKLRVSPFVGLRKYGYNDWLLRISRCTALILVFSPILPPVKYWIEQKEPEWFECLFPFLEETSRGEIKTLLTLDLQIPLELIELIVAQLIYQKE